MRWKQIGVATTGDSGLTQKRGEAYSSPEPEHGIFHRISATHRSGHGRGGGRGGAGRGVVKGDDCRGSADGEKDLNMPLNISPSVGWMNV